MNVYLDNAATTPVHSEVKRAMEPFLEDLFGNPSSVHGYGRAARQALETVRERVASALDADPTEIVFTSGGTEADNAAVFGALLGAKVKPLHMVTTAMEHHAVLNACQFAEQFGCSVTYVAPDHRGIVSPDDIEAAMRPETVLVSVMLANNETGAIQLVAEIAARVKAHGALFHTDAVQAWPVMDLSVSDLGVDLLSVSAHKIHGPKGVGALFVRRGTSWRASSFGGAQERERRPGTENLPGIAGFGEAVRLMLAGRQEKRDHIASLKTKLLSRIVGSDVGAIVNGPVAPELVLPSIVNLSFPGLSAETILMNLDLAGVAASSGSACTSGSLQPSHVLEAMGLPEDVVKSAVRFSFSDQNTIDEVEYAAQKTVEITSRLRAARR